MTDIKEKNQTLVVRGLTVNKVIETIEIHIDKMEPAAWQPRVHFDKEGLENLATSINEDGLISPITVQKLENGYEIIAGERRWRACKSIGKETIKANVVEIDDHSARLISFKENSLREDLTDQEEEKFIYGLWKKGVENRLYSTYTAMSESTGITASKISNSISAYEEREGLKKIYQGKDFDKFTTPEITGSRGMIDDLTARVQLMELKHEGKINGQELKSCSKALNEVQPNTRSVAINLLDEGKVIPSKIKSFAEIYEVAQSEIKDKMVEGEITQEEALEVIDIDDSMHRTKAIEENKTAKIVDHDNDVVQRFRTVYLESIVAFKTNDILDIKDKERQETCIDFVQKIVTYCEDILSELEIAKE